MLALKLLTISGDSRFADIPEPIGPWPQGSRPLQTSRRQHQQREKRRKARRKPRGGTRRAEPAGNRRTQHRRRRRPQRRAPLAQTEGTRNHDKKHRGGQEGREAGTAGEDDPPAEERESPAGTEARPHKGHQEPRQGRTGTEPPTQRRERSKPNRHENPQEKIGKKTTPKKHNRKRVLCLRLKTSVWFILRYSPDGGKDKNPFGVGKIFF